MYGWIGFVWCVGWLCGLVFGIVVVVLCLVCVYGGGEVGV